jgi:hypothetical protein
VEVASSPVCHTTGQADSLMPPVQDQLERDQKPIKK